MVTGKCSFNVLCVGVCVIGDLTVGTVWIFEFSASTGEGVLFVWETVIMDTRMGPLEVEQGSDNV